MTASIAMLAARIGLIVFLYAFLFLAVLTLWRSLSNEGGVLLAGKKSRNRLIRIRDGGLTPETVFLDKENLVIGRAAGADIQICDETVSTLHARIRRANDRWWLEDLESRNGTLLNDVLLEEAAALCAGDRIKIGVCVLEFRPDPEDTVPH